MRKDQIVTAKSVGFIIFISLALGCSHKNKVTASMPVPPPVPGEAPVIELLQKPKSLVVVAGSARKLIDIFVAHIDDKMVQDLMHLKQERPALRMRLLVDENKINPKQKQKLVDSQITVLSSSASVLTQLVVLDGEQVFWMDAPSVHLKSEVLAQTVHQYVDQISQDPSAEHSLLGQDQGVFIATESAADDLVLDMLAKSKKSFRVSLNRVELIESEEEDGSELLSELAARNSEIQLKVALGCAKGKADQLAQKEAIHYLRTEGVKHIKNCASKHPQSYFVADDKDVMVGLTDWINDQGHAHRKIALRWSDASSAKAIRHSQK